VGEHVSIFGHFFVPFLSLLRIDIKSSPCLVIRWHLGMADALR